MLCFSPLSRFVKVTAASLITAPLASVTVPVIVPYTFWPHPTDEVSATRTVAASNASPRFLRFVIGFLPKQFSMPGNMLRGYANPVTRRFPLRSDPTGRDRDNLLDQLC